MPTNFDIVSLGSLRQRRGVVMTRTCEADKFSGIRRVFPQLFVAPIRPLSDFNVQDETGEQFAEKIAKGFPPEVGDTPRECYRFAVLPACEEHKVPAGLICFREMQPVHVKYLLARPREARMGTQLVGATIERFQQFIAQRDADDTADNEPEGEPSETVRHYLGEIEKEKTGAKNG